MVDLTAFFFVTSVKVKTLKWVAHYSYSYQNQIHPVPLEAADKQIFVVKINPIDGLTVNPITDEAKMCCAKLHKTNEELFFGNILNAVIIGLCQDII